MDTSAFAELPRYLYTASQPPLLHFVFLVSLCQTIEKRLVCFHAKLRVTLHYICVHSSVFNVNLKLLTSCIATSIASLYVLHKFTLDEVLRHAAEVDAILRTTFAPQLQAKCSLSYPALDIRAYTELDPLTTAEVLKVRGLVSKQYVLYLSRVIEAKGIFELVEGFQTSRLPAAGYTLLVVGRGEALAELQALTEGMSNIQLITDLADAEKAAVRTTYTHFVDKRKY